MAILYLALGVPAPLRDGMFNVQHDEPEYVRKMKGEE